MRVTKRNQPYTTRRVYTITYSTHRWGSASVRVRPFPPWWVLQSCCSADERFRFDSISEGVLARATLVESPMPELQLPARETSNQTRGRLVFPFVQFPLSTPTLRVNHQQYIHRITMTEANTELRRVSRNALRESGNVNWKLCYEYEIELVSHDAFRHSQILQLVVSP